MLKEFIEAVGYLFLLIIAVVGFVLFFSAIVWFAAVVVSLMVVLWAGGVRWYIYRNKELVGHVRWFTFYPRS